MEGGEEGKDQSDRLSGDGIDLGLSLLNISADKEKGGGRRRS